MKNLKRALRNFFAKGQNNLIKILSLGAGLSVGLILTAKVCFEVSYEDFYPGKEQIFSVQTWYSSPGQDPGEHNRVSGAIAPAMMDEIPEVILATRTTRYFGTPVFFSQDKKRYTGEMLLADTCFLDMFPRPVLAGNAKDVLSRPYYIMVSRTIAENMGGIDAVMGQSIFRDDMPQVVFTIGGVFEDVPENSVIQYDILVSLESWSKWSRENWLGNDRYSAYVKLAPGVDPESLDTAIYEMQKRHQPIDELEAEGKKLTYILKPFTELHSGTPEVIRMNRLLSLLAFALIFTAVMNYILVVISSLIRRTKEVGVRKCYGAQGAQIRGILLSETLVHIVLSLLVVAGVILAFRGTIEELLDNRLESMFTLQAILILAGIVVLVFLASGLIPSLMFERIPVAAAFRDFRESRRSWKLGLLFIQFMAAAFLVVLLIVIGRQYRLMVNDDPGYAYKNVLFCSTSGTDDILQQQAVEELKRMSWVSEVSTCATIPLYYASGNNIRLPENPTNDLFNIADLYWASDNFFTLMEIPFIEGHAPGNPTEVAVSRAFLTEMDKFADWSDGAIGRNIFVTEHSQSDDPKEAFTICGIYEDIQIGNLTGVDKRPSVLFHHDPSSLYTEYILVKLHDIDSESTKAVYDIIKKAMPDKDIEVLSYSAEIRNAYSGSRRFRNSVMIGGIITVLISLAGLVGYTKDETNRRRREIALRKTNGAEINDIVRLFMVDVLKISIPATIAGCVLAGVVSVRWLEQFAKKVSLTADIYVYGSLLVLFVILFVVLTGCIRSARENPIECLRKE